MATVFFARIGNDENRAERGVPVTMALVVEKMAALERRYKPEPPIVNDSTGRNASPYSAPTLSVVEVEQSEVCAQFNKAGYYWFTGLTPAQCSALLGLGPP